MIVADQDLHSFLGRSMRRVFTTGRHLANAAFTLLFYQKDSEREHLRESFSGLPTAYFESLFSCRGAFAWRSSRRPPARACAPIGLRATGVIVAPGGPAACKGVVDRMIQEVSG